jgi:hypothetical protein
MCRAEILIFIFVFQPEKDQEDAGGREEPEREEVHEHVQQRGDTRGGQLSRQVGAPFHREHAIAKEKQKIHKCNNYMYFYIGADGLNFSVLLRFFSFLLTSFILPVRKCLRTFTDKSKPLAVVCNSCLKPHESFSKAFWQVVFTAFRRVTLLPVAIMRI